jgi:biopolymer transport protein ExbD
MTRRRVSEPDGEIVIPVTPMLDMTFQLLIFFIVTFNPNRLIEGFWDVTVSDETITQRNDKENTGDKNDRQTINSEVKPVYDALKVKFDEDRAKSYFEGIAKATYPDKNLGASEDNPRSIDPQEIEQIYDKKDREFARDLAPKDQGCFILELITDIASDGTGHGKAEKLPYDKMKERLEERIQLHRKTVEKKHEGIADQKEREAAIAKDMADYKIVIAGDKTLRWWRFNQIRDLCYGAGYRNIQAGQPE